MFDETKIRLAAAAALLGIVVPGCTSDSPTSAPPISPNTATVSVNGRDAGDRLFVRCSQIQWLLTIDAVDQASGFTAMVSKVGGGPDPKFVKIRDVAGFTGSAWDGGVGHIEARRDGAVLTLEGSGYGFFADNPGEPTTAAFSITTAC